MSELIRREDCDFFDSSLGTDVMIWDLVDDFHLNQRSRIYEDDLREFARMVLQKAQKVVDAAPTITTDEVLAYKCPECKVVSILYNPTMERHCPNCGCGRK